MSAEIQRTPVERLAIAEEKLRAAHQRIDRFETNVQRTLEDIQDDVKILLGYMNRGKGWTAAAIAFATAAGGAIGWLIEHFEIFK